MKRIKRIEREIEATYDFDGLYQDATANGGSTFLGCIHAILPSENWLVETDEDEEYFEALDNVAGKYNLAVESGADPCDILLTVIEEEEEEDYNARGDYGHYSDYSEYGNWASIAVGLATAVNANGNGLTFGEILPIVGFLFVVGLIFVFFLSQTQGNRHADEIARRVERRQTGRR